MNIIASGGEIIMSNPTNRIQTFIRQTLEIESSQWRSQAETWKTWRMLPHRRNRHRDTHKIWSRFDILVNRDNLVRREIKRSDGERRTGKVAVFVVTCRFVGCSPWSAPAWRFSTFLLHDFWYLEAIWDSNADNTEPVERSYLDVSCFGFLWWHRSRRSIEV